MDPVPTESSYVVPNPRIPKVLGILNIVFASALMICGLCSIAYYSLVPTFSAAVEKVQNDVIERERKDRQLVLEAFDEEEQAAATEEAKAEIREKRKRYEAGTPLTKPVAMDFGQKILEGTGVRAYVWVEFLTGLLLNLLLLTAGIGLVMRRRWGLNLGLGVAALKILRLVLVYGYAAIVLAPPVAQGMAKFQIQQMQTMAKQQGGKPLPPEITVEFMTRWVSIWLTTCAVGMIIIGLIYPVVSLWLLSRPSARAACSDGQEATGPGPGQVESW